MARLQHLRDESARIYNRLGYQRVNISVLEPDAITSPPDDVRKEGAAMMRDFPAVAEVTVLERAGFRAAAARAILSGMALFAGHTRRIFDSVAAAAAWIVANGHARGMTEADVIAFVEYARAAIPQR
jgi:hypothetical protein